MELDDILQDMSARLALRSSTTYQRIRDLLEVELRSRMRLSWDAYQRSISAAGIAPNKTMVDKICTNIGALARDIEPHLVGQVRSQIASIDADIPWMECFANEELCYFSSNGSNGISGKSVTLQAVIHPIPHTKKVVNYEFDVFSSHASEDKAAVAQRKKWVDRK